MTSSYEECRYWRLILEELKEKEYRLNTWEIKFVNGLYKRGYRLKGLTEKQMETLEKLRDEYR